MELKFISRRKTKDEPMNTSAEATASSQGKRTEIVVQMRGVSRFFDPGCVRALSNVTFEVYRGEIFGLLGPFGCGKSTAIRILAGWLSPSEGKARVFARSPRRRGVKTRISFLPQKPSDAHSRFLTQAIGFFRDLVAGANRNEGSEGVPFIANGRERIAAMKRIVVQNTRLVLLDEPFLSLDASSRDEMMELIRAVAQNGRTVVLCSRSLLHAKSVCDRIAVLHRGELQAVGTLEQLLATRENLRFLVDVLPDETTETLLKIIRREVGVPGAANSPPLEPQKESPQPVQGVQLQCAPAPTESVADKLLTPLLKTVPATENRVAHPTSSVDHDLLEALTKPASEKPTPRPEE